MKNIRFNTCATLLIAIAFSLLLGCRSSNNEPIEKIENVMGESNRAAFATRPVDVSSYIIQIEDEINIQILAQSDRAPLVSVTNLSVDNRGIIFLPIIGELKVAGLTQAQLREELAKAYKDEFRSPEIIATIPNPGGMKVFVLGEVKKPGVYNLGFRTTALEGILLAGGFSTNAEAKLVVVLRPPPFGVKEAEEAATNIGVIDFEKMLTKADIRQNINLRSGDVLYIPPDDITHTNRLYTHLNNMITPFAAVISSVAAVVVLQNSF